MSRGRKQEAQDLLENQVFITALEDLRLVLFKSWCKSSNVDERDKIHAECSALDRITRYVKATAEDIKNGQ